MKKIFRLLRYDWPLHFILLVTNWLPDNIKFIRLRGKLASYFFKSCGIKLGIGRGVTFYNPSQISIGSDVYIGYGCWFLGSDGITIHDEVLFGPYVVISASDHTKKNGSFRYGLPKGDKVIINYGAWIGAHCSIASGTQIGKGSVIGANSFVNRNVDDSVLFAGNPAKFIKNI